MANLPPSGENRNLCLPEQLVDALSLEAIGCLLELLRAPDGLTVEQLASRFGTTAGVKRGLKQLHQLELAVYTVRRSGVGTFSGHLWQLDASLVRHTTTRKTANPADLSTRNNSPPGENDRVDENTGRSPTFTLLVNTYLLLGEKLSSLTTYVPKKQSKGSDPPGYEAGSWELRMSRRFYASMRTVNRITRQYRDNPAKAEQDGAHIFHQLKTLDGKSEKHVEEVLRCGLGKRSWYMTTRGAIWSPQKLRRLTKSGEATHFEVMEQMLYASRERSEKPAAPGQRASGAGMISTFSDDLLEQLRKENHG